jgi:peptidoglycan/LPS O-acetylase OafA/YrhL/O-antigen/teichoic acid export membrane protein/glycosyltransferase involved in cell wall biosynthesis
VKLGIVAFPRDPNPYQELLYTEMRADGETVRYAGELTRSRTLNLLLLPLELMVRRALGATVFHLHWTFGFAWTRPFPRRLSRAWFQLILHVTRRCGYRVVWTAHNVLPHDRVFDDDERARRALVDGCDLVIAHSAHAVEGLRDIGAAPHRAVVIPHGPISAPRVSELRATPPQGRRCVLFLGRIATYKGVEDLIEAVAGGTAELRVVIAGACPDRELGARLRRAATGAGDRVALRLGFVADEDLAGLLEGSDAVVYPFRSITTSGSVMLGLAAGRPAVVPDLPALAGLPDEAVFRYPPGVDGLRSALERVSTASDEDLESMGAAARAASAPMSWSGIAAMTRDAIADDRVLRSEPATAVSEDVPRLALEPEPADRTTTFATPGPTADEPTAASGVIARTIAAARADALTRSSVLLVFSYLVVGLLGGICTIIAARSWSPSDVGAVAAITGVVTLLTTATSSGVASAITRFLGSEDDQLSFVLEATALVSALGALVTAAICFVPGHFGVPIHEVFGSDAVAFGFMGGYVVVSNIVAVTDPAFVARREVSYTTVKDILASLCRVGILVALIGSASQWLFGAALIAAALAAAMDLALVVWRLRNARGRPPLLAFRSLRRRLRFVAGSHSAALVAALPAQLLVVIVAATLGAREAAFVGIPVLILAFVTIIPSMISQALLTELERPASEVPATAARALRLAYLGTLPASLILIVAAPKVLMVFGSSYAAHGTQFLRWIAAGTIFSTFNYVADTVLLGRQRVLAYNAVNVLGTVAILGCIVVSITHGFAWLGPGLFVGQALYALVAIATLSRFARPSDAARAIAALGWSPGGAPVGDASPAVRGGRFTRWGGRRVRTVDPPVEQREKTTSTGVHRLRFLDGIRGAAAVYVVISHVWDTAFARRTPNILALREATGFLGFGRYAVSVFIIVSGYSIGLAVWRGGMRWPGGTRRYLHRRFVRIWPPFAAAAAISSLLAATVLSHDVGTLYDAANNIRPSGVITNLLLLQDVHYAGPAGSSAFWSIAVEFHIYLFFLLLLVGMRRSMRWAPIAIFTLIALTTAAVADPGNPVLHWVAGMTPSLYVLFIIGFLAGRTAVDGVPFSDRRWNRLLASIALAGLVAIVVCRREWVPLNQLSDFVVGPVAAFVIVRLTQGRLRGLVRVFNSRIAVWLGDCSYSLYLIHAVVIEGVWRVAVVPVTTNPGLRLVLELVIAVPASVAVARVFYLVVERPAMRARGRGRDTPPLRVVEVDGLSAGGHDLVLGSQVSREPESVVA